MAYTNEEISWDLTQLRRFYTNYVIKWLNSAMSWTAAQVARARANVGGIVDVSVLNASGGTAQPYASLSAALADVPVTYQRGAVEIQYIDSTTSKYVKYRLMAGSWSTTESDWQGVDDDPAANSNNLVKSGGVYNLISSLVIGKNYPAYSVVNNQYINYQGVISSLSGGKYTSPILLQEGETISFHGKGNSVVAAISLTNEQGTSYTKVVSGGSTQTMEEKDYVYTALETCYVCLSAFDIMTNVIIATDDGLKQKIEELKKEVDGGNYIPSYSITNNQYINYQGVISSFNGSKMTSPIRIYKGDTISFHGSGNSVVAAISLTNEQGTSYTKVVSGGSTQTMEEKDYSYTALETCYVCLSSLVNITNVLWSKQGLEPRLLAMESDISQLRGKVSTLETYNDGGNILAAFDNMVCIGDSLTYSQVYTSASESRQAKRTYPEILASMCGNDYTLLAVGGYTAKAAWDNFKNDIVAKENAIGIVYLGTNGGITDTLDTDVVGDDTSDWADNNVGCYCRIIEKMQSLGYKVLLIQPWATSGTGSSDLTNTNNAIQHIASRFSCAIIDSFHTEKVAYHYYPDRSGANQLHYNDLGYSWFATQLIKKVSILPNDILSLIIPE